MMAEAYPLVRCRSSSEIRLIQLFRFLNFSFFYLLSAFHYFSSQRFSFQHFTKVERGKFDYVKGGRTARVAKIERTKLADVTPGKINGTN